MNSQNSGQIICRHNLGPEVEGKYSTDLFVNRANTLFEEHKDGDKPWFTYLSFQSVHDPIQVFKFKYKSI